MDTVFLGPRDLELRSETAAVGTTLGLDRWSLCSLGGRTRQNYLRDVSRSRKDNSQFLPEELRSRGMKR